MDINKKAWNEVNRADLIDLYVNKDFTDQEVSKCYNVSKSQVIYKRKKLKLSFAELQFKKFLTLQNNDSLNNLQENMKMSVTEIDTEIIAKSLAHYVFRNGPIEDMHANEQLSENDMMVLNKYIYDRLNTIIYLLKENDWIRLALLLDFNKYYGSSWDEPTLCIDEFDKIAALGIKIQ